VIERSLRLGVDGIGFGDDWGTQTQLMISPRLWREFFKPRYKKMFDLIHSAGAHVYFHSDGMTLEIVPDLIEIGVDVLNPQFSCLDLKALAQISGGKVCIATDLDRQFVLPFGTPEEVREHVREVVKTLWHPHGGIIGRGEIGPDVPLENAEAMFQAFREFGVYGA
jgi:uroporphyrinogen-III decarboxylase